MKRTKKTVGIFLILMILFPLMIQISVLNLKDNPIIKKDQEKLQHSGEIINTKQWIKNSNFSTQQHWYSSTEGDSSDIIATISGGNAQYKIIGNESIFSIEAFKTNKSKWQVMLNPDFPAYPEWDGADQYDIDDGGFWTRHKWTEGPRQTPSVNWIQNVTLDVNISDYIITSAEISALFNASVNENVDVDPSIYGDDVSARPDGNPSGPQGAVYDYVRSYIKIVSPDWLDNPAENPPYTIAFNRTCRLGLNNTSTGEAILEINDTSMETVEEDDLIFYLDSVLSQDYKNFIIIAGIDIFCEDNCYSDRDYFDDLRIKTFSLNFTCEKKIDQSTSVSWNQDTEKPNDITTNPIVVDEALLDFEYMINETWTSSSPNSEIRMYINNIQHTETVKLSTASTSFQKAKLGGFDVTPLIQEDKMINLSIQVYLADEFALSRSFNISIDNVYLNITYTETVPDINTNLKLFLNGVDKTSDKIIILPLAEDLNITVKYTNQSGDYIPGATIQLEGKVNGTLDPYPVLEQYTIIVNTTELGIGSKILTVMADKFLYTSQEINFLVEVTERETEILLYLNNIPKLNEETIQLELNETLDVKIEYKDNITKNLLKNATVELVGFGDLNETNGQYEIKLNATDLGQGITAFTIYAQKLNYLPQSIKFYVEIFERKTELLLFLNGNATNDGETIQMKIDDIINVTIYYRDNYSKQHLAGATVNLVGVGKFNETNNYYNTTIYCADLDQGFSVFTIYAELDNYQSQSIQFLVELIDIKTDLFLFLNGNSTNDGETIQVTIDDSINVTVYYRDDLNQHISGARVNLVGVGEFNETGDYYNFTINAMDLNQGVSVFTIYAELDNYQSQSIQFLVELVDIETNLSLFIDDNPINDGEKIQVDIRDLINVTIYYRDDLDQHISGAIVNLVGVGEFNETNNYYNFTINAADLSQGITVFTIYAQLDNYQSQSIQFLVELVDIETNISLFIDGNPTNNGEKIQVEIDDSINITIYYKDELNQHISGATVNLVGRGLLNETNGYYNMTINAIDLDQGITVLTIYAQLDNYQIQSIQFLVEIVDRATELLLFIDGNPTNDGDTIQVETDDLINLTVYYRDNETKISIPGAIVDLVGKGQLNETHDYYNITINAIDLDQGITVLTIFAQLVNYQPQSIQFFVKVVERASSIQIFLNNEDRTSDPTFSLTIGQVLNMTVKYKDNQTGNHIPTAIVQLIGQEFTWNFTRDDILGQHYLILNTSELSIGVKLFSIVAQANNYKIKVIYPRITVNRISADIRTVSQEDQIEAEIGDDVLLQIFLNDTIFGDDIPGAMVTYTWAYGQGELEDLDNDGIYEILLQNVREGIHSITINAFAGDNYAFESYKITLYVSAPTVSPGPDLSWLVYVLVGAIAGLTIIFTLYQTHFKYPPMVRKIRKLKKKVKKAKKTKPILVNKRDEIINNELQNQMKTIEYEVVQPAKGDKIEKTPIKEGGED